MSDLLKVELTEQQWRIVGGYTAQGPYSQVVDILESIQTQLDAQAPVVIPEPTNSEELPTTGNGVQTVE